MVSLIMPNAVIKRKFCLFLTLYRCILDIVTLSDFEYQPTESEGDKV